jgi:hypothetical protein
MGMVAVEARKKFKNYIDLLDGFASGPMNNAEFAARVRRRSNGEAEDFDEDVHPPFSKCLGLTTSRQSASHTSCSRRSTAYAGR